MRVRLLFYLDNLRPSCLVLSNHVSVILPRFENSRNVEMTVHFSVWRKWQELTGQAPDVPVPHSRAQFFPHPASHEAGSPARRWRSAWLSKSFSSVISLGRTVFSFAACRGVRSPKPAPARRATCDNALRRIALIARPVPPVESRASCLLGAPALASTPGRRLRKRSL